jgi:GR25 family glycosyltransferase involved in LPS biosynthesis
MNDNITVFFLTNQKEDIWETDFILKTLLPKNQKQTIKYSNGENISDSCDVFVYNSRLHTFEKILEIVERIHPKIIIHLSDEFNFENKNQYNQLGNHCELFLREYHHDGYEYTENTIHIPLGYCNDADLEGKYIPTIEERTYNWSFVGDMKSDRWEMLEQFSKIDRNFTGTQVSKSDMMNAYINSVFVPCGRGNSTLDCFRLYEASMAGAIPVVVGSREEISCTFKYEENPPWIFAETWEAASNYCKELLNDYEALQKMQDNLLYWWRTRIHKIKSQLKKVLISKTLPIKVVQVGTNRGYDDLSRHLITNYDSLEFALFVEPNQLHLQDIKDCYQKFDNAIIENVAIKTVLDPNEEMTIYYHLDDAPEYQIASTDLNHILKHGHLHHDEDKIKSFTVPCLTLHELFEKYDITELDWLLLDIEGLDAEILLTTDWKPYKIRRIEFEQLHLGEYKSAVYNMFIGLGYKQVNSLHEYDWAFENDNVDFKDINQKLEDFPPVHFISIEESEDRRKSLYKKFKNYGITNAAPHIFQRYKDEDHVVYGEYLYRWTGIGRGPTTSHLKAIKEWYNNTDEEYAFFCEDDLSFDTVKYWNFTWKEFFSSLPSDWECIQLSWIKEDFYRFLVELRSRCWCDWSATAYLISRKFAKKLIDNYHYDDAFHLDLKGDDVIHREEWAKIPVVETIIFSALGKVYGFPMFIEDLQFQSTIGTDFSEGSFQKHSHANTIEWWKHTGQFLTLDKIIKTQ